MSQRRASQMQSTQGSPSDNYRKRIRIIASKKAYKPVVAKQGKQAFPLQQSCTLKYCEQRAVTPIGGLTFYQLVANGLFDPNATGGGHQPMYFDTYMGIYNHYHVMKSRIKITALPNSTNTSPWLACIYVDDDTSIVSSFEQALEQKATSKAVTWLPAASNPMPMYLSWDAKKYFGPSPQTNPELQGTAATNPTEKSYFTFVAQDTALSTSAYTVLIEIEYDVIFDELKTQPQS